MTLSGHSSSGHESTLPGGDKPHWKQRLRQEMVAYWITVLYLAFYFGVFFSYRRLLLAQYQISYQNYGIALIEALVLAKVILIGDLLHLGHGLEDKPLIYPTLFRSLVFTIWVAIFKFVEQTVKGLIHDGGLGGGIDYVLSTGKYEYFASCLVVFFTFMPFFAIKEMVRVTGRGKIWHLFFRHRAPGDFNFGSALALNHPPGAEAASDK